MATVEELLDLAADHYERARASSNFLVRAQLKVMGDDYLKQADVQAGRPVVQAAFPKLDTEFG